VNLIHTRDELPQKVFREMLHSIKSDTFECDLFREPQTPVQNVGFDLWVCVVEVCEHEVVVVTLLRINVSTLSPPLCLITEDLVDGCLVVVRIVVSATEVIPMIFLLRVFIPSTREVEAEPSVDFIGVRDGLVSVFFVNFLGFASFFVVCSCFVVEDLGGQRCFVTIGEGEDVPASQ
jgi:hypothetical protein